MKEDIIYRQKRPHDPHSFRLASAFPLFVWKGKVKAQLTAYIEILNRHAMQGQIIYDNYRYIFAGSLEHIIRSSKRAAPA